MFKISLFKSHSLFFWLITIQYRLFCIMSAVDLTLKGTTPNFDPDLFWIMRVITIFILWMEVEDYFLGCRSYKPLGRPIRTLLIRLFFNIFDIKIIVRDEERLLGLELRSHLHLKSCYLDQVACTHIVVN